MQFVSKILSFAGQHIFVGIDVHNKSWVITILTQDMEHKTFTQPPSVDALVNYLRRFFPDAHYHCVYEAGYSGFWICEELRAKGVDCMIVHPADVPTSDKEKQHKTNRRDSRKLARHLRNNDLHGIYVPSKQVLYDRSFVRTRRMLVKKQTRCKNQIKAFLSFFNIHISDDRVNGYWSKRYICALQELKLPHESGTQSLHVLLNELVSLRESIAGVTKQIRRLSMTDRYHENVLHLMSLPGISTISAMILLTELDTIARFCSLDVLVSYFGLIPSEHSTGEERTMGDITDRKNPYLRHLIIECAWTAVRNDPTLLAAFETLSARMPKNRAIIRIARKLVARIRFVLRNNVPYEMRLPSQEGKVCEA